MRKIVLEESDSESEEDEDSEVDSKGT